MESLIAGLLQATFVFLSAVQANPSLSDGALDRAVNHGSQVVQFSTWVLETDPPAMRTVPVSTVPRVSGLLSANYLISDGKRTRLGLGSGENLRLEQEYVSFGDLNRDNVDDAMVVLRGAKPGGGASYRLAAMLNFGGELFNITMLDLGEELEIFSHEINYGKYAAEMRVGSGERRRYDYKLVGRELMRL
ncbi:hypothetical protein C4587_00110 [Candidatus Parcubacteria bacterium]|nr:MAG: hypothetical protein C4587_00110 [Candidatus Parcubacteria bacterium]